MVLSSDMQKNAEMEAEGALSLDELGAADAMSEDGDESVTSVYEIAYHLLPTVPEEGLTAEVKKIHDFLIENGASLVGDRFPTPFHLAYTLTKRIAGKIERFTDAHFGWVAFEMPRANSVRLKTWLDENPSMLRFLITRTSKDEVAASLAGAVAHLPTVRAIGNIDKPKREAEISAGGEVSEKALDEALETIATEDEKASE